MNSTYFVKAGDCITSSTSTYQVQKILGSGGFGVVTLCSKNNSSQTVALKVLKSQYYKDYGQQEAMILRRLRERDSGPYHIVQWIDSFQYRDHYCHEFEKLDISLTTYLTKAPFESLSLKKIRPILTQITGALLFLKSVGVIHGDLKPENIMMINHVQQPLKIKLIDFGLACLVSEARPGRILQTLSYKAPEVVLGSSFSETADMWSLGCTAVEMFLGKQLFRAHDSDDLVRMMVQTLGQPPKHVLDTGYFTRHYFNRPEGSSDWIHVIKEKKRQIRCTVSSLAAIYGMDPYAEVRDCSEAENFDRAVFIDLVKRMLNLDPKTRISPEEVLDHPFLTLTHLTPNYRQYGLACKRIQLQAFDLDRREEQLSTASTSPSSPQTPEAPQAQTCGLKRTREEEEESPQKRKRRDDSVVRSAQKSEQSSDVIILESVGANRKRKWTGEEDMLDAVCKNKKRKRKENIIDLDSAHHNRERKSEERTDLDSFSTNSSKNQNVTVGCAECPDVIVVTSGPDVIVVTSGPDVIVVTSGPLSLGPNSPRPNRKRKQEEVIDLTSTSPKQRRH